jgi:hypothetical protein
MRKLHVLRAAQNLDRSLAGSLLDPARAVYVRPLESIKWPFLSGCKVRSSVAHGRRRRHAAAGNSLVTVAAVIALTLALIGAAVADSSR